MLVLQERKTRLVLIEKICSKQPNHINQHLTEMIQEFGQEHFKTITTDNGIEFYNLYKLENPLNFLTYYARPYRSGDKGSIENVNSIIRRWFPKGTNFNLVTDGKIRMVETSINNLPRKILKWNSAIEKFNME